MLALAHDVVADDDDENARHDDHRSVVRLKCSDVEEPRQYTLVTNTHTTNFLSRCRRVDAKDKLTAICYTLFTGGSYYVEDGHKASIFYKMYALDLRRGTVPAINEIHSIKFPMYVDMDFKTTFRTISSECIVSIVNTVSEQLDRFFPRAPPFRCVVCTKTKGGTECGDGMWKHGIHLHWPEVVVQVEQAFQLRLSMIVGLDRRTDWTSLMGTKRPEWSSIVDEGVYRRSSNASARSGGLRMVGAPKAKKCKACTSDMCIDCGFHNNRHVVDTNVYALYGVMCASRLVDDSELRHDTHALVMATTVRRNVGVDVTPGYTPYVGCPLAPSIFASSSSSSTSSRKRKAVDDDVKRLGARFVHNPEIDDASVVQVVRSLLLRHSEHYERSRPSIRFDGQAYRVTLSGDGATFCLNKQAPHNSQRVYMEIVRAGACISRMRCWCRCPVVRSFGAQPCSKFKSAAIELSHSEMTKLFVVDVSPSAHAKQQLEAQESRVRELMRKIELRRAATSTPAVPTSNSDPHAPAPAHVHTMTPASSSTSSGSHILWS